MDWADRQFTVEYGGMVLTMNLDEYIAFTTRRDFSHATTPGNGGGGGGSGPSADGIGSGGLDGLLEGTHDGLLEGA